MNDPTKDQSRIPTAKIRWTIEFEYPVCEGDDEIIKSYYEGNHCQENLLSYLSENCEDGICKMCFIGEVKVLEINK